MGEVSKKVHHSKLVKIGLSIYAPFARWAVIQNFVLKAHILRKSWSFSQAFFGSNLSSLYDSGSFIHSRLSGSELFRTDAIEIKNPISITNFIATGKGNYCCIKNELKNYSLHKI